MKGQGLKRLHTQRSQKISITVLSDKNAWMNPWIQKLLAKWADSRLILSWVHEPSDVPEGELCFILSCSKLVNPGILQKNRHNLVVHASDLPKGKGWSPWTWQIIEGENSIPLTLFEAVDAVDSGFIYLQEWIEFQGHELIDEIRASIAGKIATMCQKFIDSYPDIVERGREQQGEESFYPRRRPKDSQLDIERSIKDQFDLLRVVDNKRYPAFFEYRGCRYILKIEKV